MTLLAPMISKQRRVGWPIRDVRPSRSLPPAERCTDVSPTQATKSRSEPNVSGGGVNASMAVAIGGPIPGTLIGRRAVSSALARAGISASKAAICCCR